MPARSRSSVAGRRARAPRRAVSAAAPGRGGRQPHERRGDVVLRSPAGSVARVAVDAGCCIHAWEVAGRERLHLPAPAAEFLRQDRTGGVPLLFPWANRLRGASLSALGRTISLRGPRVHRDAEGRPMHGLLLRWPRWEVEATADRLVATLEWAAHPELMRLFPFPQRLSLDVRLRDQAGGARLTVVTRIEAAETPVPVSFGWHPYLRLPGPRAACSLRLPASPAIRRVELEAQLPVRRGGALATTGAAALGGGLGTRTLDDLLAGAVAGDVLAVEGPGGVAALELASGYRYVQVYSPRGAPFACLEPMTAPTAALSDGAAELPVLGPGAAFTAVYSLSVVDGRSS